MGYTCTTKPQGMTVAEYFQNRILNDKCTIVDSALVNLHEFYAAVRNNDTQEVWAFIAKVDLNINYHGYNFGYRYEHESMGPYRYNCPERILKLLTPTAEEYAIEWRKKCWERIRIHERAAKLSSGAVIEFDEVISFTNGDNESRFIVIKDQRKVLFRGMTTNTLYKITGWKDRIFSILNGSKQPAVRISQATLF